MQYSTSASDFASLNIHKVHKTLEIPELSGKLGTYFNSNNPFVFKVNDYTASGH